MNVAAYCRVSTDKEDQANSFESQQRFFREYIAHHPDWSLFGIYADEGITGTSVKKRAAFQRMMRDAEQGCFSLIVTKEISRFARNTLDSIYYTRKLKALGVGVLFLNDNLNTLQEDSELILAIKSTIAQEESRATSSRVKWGQTRRMEQGIVFGRSLLGYDVADGKMCVNPEGAAIVRMIFHKYVTEGKGSTTIARELQEAGCRTLTGSVRWRSSVVLKILHNEKYCGDLMQKKTITPDFLTHKKQYNHGEEDLVYLRDHHEPIVSREVWEQAQRELNRRNVHKKEAAGHGNRYPLSGKIQCGVCGKSFVSRSRKRKDGSHYHIWRCGTAASEGLPQPAARGEPRGCGVGCQITDELAGEMVSQALFSLPVDRDTIIREAARAAAEAIRASDCSDRQAAERLRREAALLEKKKKLALDAYLSGDIPKADFFLIKDTYDRRLAELSESLQRSEHLLRPDGDASSLENTLYDKIQYATDHGLLNQWFCSVLLEQIRVYSNQRIVLRLKGLPEEWDFSLQPPSTRATDPTEGRQPSDAAGSPHSTFSGGGESRAQSDASVPISVNTACSAGYGME